MCGVCGFVGDYSSDRLDRMMQVIAHRGPDDHGKFWAPIQNGSSAIGLGSRRLAILDLSPAAHMPMSTPDGALTIVYNGEIYNYPALRAASRRQGVPVPLAQRHRGRTLLVPGVRTGQCQAAQRHVRDCTLGRARSEALFLARDHFGIKPLYYTTQRPRVQLRVGSEVAAPVARRRRGRSIRRRCTST